MRGPLLAWAVRVGAPPGRAPVLLLCTQTPPHPKSFEHPPAGGCGGLPGLVGARGAELAACKGKARRRWQLKGSAGHLPGKIATATGAAIAAPRCELLVALAEVPCRPRTSLVGSLCLGCPSLCWLAWVRHLQALCGVSARWEGADAVRN